MSYILDALNRSNAESVQDPRALLTPNAQNSPRSILVPTLLIALLGLNLALGAWWLMQGAPAATMEAAIPTAPALIGSSASERPAKQGAANVSVQARIAPQERQTAPQTARPRSAERPPPQSDAAIATPQPPAPALAATEELITPQRPAKPRPIPIGALPRGIQEQIPDLAFSSHIYAEDAQLRMVNINGELYRQGDTIARGVKLLEITEEGAVMSYLHYTFEVGVLEDWAL